MGSRKLATKTKTTTTCHAFPRHSVTLFLYVAFRRLQKNNYAGLLMLSFCIRDLNVLVFKPSRTAAPRLPSMIQFVSSRVRIICWRSRSFNLSESGTNCSSFFSGMRISYFGKIPIKPPMITALSIIFSSSLTFPGHW